MNHVSLCKCFAGQLCLYRILHTNKCTTCTSRPRLTLHGTLLDYCVDPQPLTAHRTTTSSSRAKFKVRLLLGPPTYRNYLTDVAE